MNKRCDRHDRTYDGALMESCPDCEAQGVLIARKRVGYVARFDSDDPDSGRTIYGIGYSEDQAVVNLLEHA